MKKAGSGTGTTSRPVYRAGAQCFSLLLLFDGRLLSVDSVVSAARLVFFFFSKAFCFRKARVVPSTKGKRKGSRTCEKLDSSDSNEADAKCGTQNDARKKNAETMLRARLSGSMKPGNDLPNYPSRSPKKGTPFCLQVRFKNESGPRNKRQDDEHDEGKMRGQRKKRHALDNCVARC